MGMKIKSRLQALSEDFRHDRCTMDSLSKYYNYNYNYYKTVGKTVLCVICGLRWKFASLAMHRNK